MLALADGAALPVGLSPQQHDEDGLVSYPYDLPQWWYVGRLPGAATGPPQLVDSWENRRVLLRR